MTINYLTPIAFTISAFVNIFAPKLYFTKNEYIDPITRLNIESKIQTLCAKLGITKPVELIISSKVDNGLAHGVSCLPGRAGIILNPEFLRSLPTGELEFLLAHELSHIKSNDYIRIPGIAALSSAIAILALSILFPTWAKPFTSKLAQEQLRSPLAVIGIPVSFIALNISSIITSRWRETCADKLGWSACSPEVQRAAPRFFDTKRNNLSWLRAQKDAPLLTRLWRKMTISESGDNRCDVCHPSFSTRINYLEALVQQAQGK